jgi:hypothetical protein
MTHPLRGLAVIGLALCTGCLFPSAQRTSPSAFRTTSALSPVAVEMTSTSRTMGQSTIDFELISLVDATWLSAELELPEGVRLIALDLPGGPVKVGDSLAGSATIELPSAVRRGRCCVEIILSTLLDRRAADGQLETLSTQTAILFGDPLRRTTSVAVAHADVER